MELNKARTRRQYMMKYSQFHPAVEIFTVILFVQNILSVQTDNLRINVTRQNDGDILVFDGNVDCSSMNANCIRVPNNQGNASEQNRCERCRCSSQHTTYVSRVDKCIHTNEMTALGCQIVRQKRTTLVGKSTRVIKRPIRANHCEAVKGQPPEFYATFHSNNENAGWIRMADVRFSLRSRRSKKENLSFRNWLVMFQKDAISKMVSKYAGRIVKFKFRCKMRPKAKKYTDWCIISKITGSFVGNSTITTQYRLYRPISVNTSTSLYTTPDGFSTKILTTMKPPGNHTNQDQKSQSRKSAQAIWIVITVLIVIIIVLSGIIFFICSKKRKAKQSNEECGRKDSIQLHEYDVPIKSPFDENTAGRSEHIYETVPETRNANSACPSSPADQYQELNPDSREKEEASDYQPLVNHVQPQYVDILPDP